MLRPQDIVVLLKIHNQRGASWTYKELADSLHISASEVHTALKRCSASGLYDGAARRVEREPLLEFLIHGIKYVFYAQPGRLSRGMPTAHSSQPLSGLLAHTADEAYVWPDAAGTIRGQAIEPLYKSVPQVAKTDPQLYELLSLIDGIRVGRARERRIASQELEQRLLAA